MKIIKYEEKYRDDMIFMILQAKDALGRVIRVHLGGKEWFESRAFYPKHGYVEYADRYMKKEL